MLEFRGDRDALSDASVYTRRRGYDDNQAVVRPTPKWEGAFNSRSLLNETVCMHDDARLSLVILQPVCSNSAWYGDRHALRGAQYSLDIKVRGDLCLCPADGHDPRYSCDACSCCMLVSWLLHFSNKLKRKHLMAISQRIVAKRSPFQPSHVASP